MKCWESSRKSRNVPINKLALVYVNLINYMDRSTVAGLLEEIKKDKDFDIHKVRDYYEVLFCPSTGRKK